MERRPNRESRTSKRKDVCLYLRGPIGQNLRVESATYLAKRISDRVGQVDGSEAAHAPLVQIQKLPAGRKVIVHDVESLAVDPALQPGEDDGFRAVVDIGQRQRVRPAEMKEDAERPDADTTSKRYFDRKPLERRCPRASP